jgi:hypothetical protein
MDVISGGWRDNVPRRRDFESRHPEISIECEGWGRRWYACRDGEEIVQATDLGRLLNRLEILTGEREPGRS